MSKLAEQIEQKRAELANLEQQALTATCRELGRHTWKQMGGMNCGCPRDLGWCSLPVYECSVCGVCDYGENDESQQIKSGCEIPRLSQQNPDRDDMQGERGVG